MDLEASLSSGTAEDVMSFDTTIRNASAAAFVSFGQREYLAITQHSYSAKTFLIDIKKARLAGTAVDSIVFTYRSASFSQGIAFADGIVFDAVNKIGIDTIVRYRLSAAIESGTYRTELLLPIAAPNTMIEDLVIERDMIYTSDESSYLLYRLPLSGIRP